MKESLEKKTGPVGKDQNWIYDATDEQLIQELTPNNDATKNRAIAFLFWLCSLCAGAGKWGGDFVAMIAIAIPCAIAFMWLLLESASQPQAQEHQRAVLQELQRRSRQKNQPAS